MVRRHITKWALLAAVVPAMAVAQPRGHQRPWAHGARGPMGVLRELDLSDDQREQIRALVEEQGALGSHERLIALRESLQDAVENGADEGEIRQLAYELGVAEGDAAVDRARLHARVQEVLTEEQRAELAKLREERKQREEERRKRFEELRERRNQKRGSL